MTTSSRNVANTQMAQINQLNFLLDRFANEMDAFLAKMHESLNVNDEHLLNERMTSVITKKEELWFQQLSLVEQYSLYVENRDDAQIRQQTLALYEGANPRNMLVRLRELDNEFDEAMNDLSRAPTERSEPS